MRGSEIIVSADPKGEFLEGVISDTSSPGTLMQIDTSKTTMQSGRFWWKAAAVSGAGTKPTQGCVVLLPDWLQGRLSTGTYAAYVAGTRCFMYSPRSGEELNVLCGTGAGTSNTFTFGQTLMLPASSAGILVATTGSPTWVPFSTLEADTQVVADTLVWCMYTAGGA